MPITRCFPHGRRMAVDAGSWGSCSAVSDLADVNGRLSCGSPRLVALGIFGALTKLKSAANDIPYTSQVVLGLFGQCNAQASKVAHWTKREPAGQLQEVVEGRRDKGLD